MKIIENNKVYILIDDYFNGYENTIKVVAVTSNESNIKQIMDKYIKEVKKEVNFDSLNIIENDNDYGCIVKKDNNSFSLYINDEYKHDLIKVYYEEHELVTYKEYENKDIGYEK